jgi:DNA-binding XRE family transcriptional regulator
MKKTTESTYPNRLKPYREWLRIKQKDLAEAIGVSKQTLNNHESGIRPISLQYPQWVKLRKALNLDEDELLQLLDSSLANLPIDPFVKNK